MRSRHGRYDQWSHAHPQEVRFDPRGRGDAEPDRGSEELLRRFPDGQGTPWRAPGRSWAAGGVQVGVSDLGLLGQGHARVRTIRVRPAQVRRRRVHAARHDVLGAAEGQAAPHRVRCERGDRLQVDQGRQGAGRLHGRHAADDLERNVRHQRHRARDRLADAPLAGRILRSRPWPHARLRQAPVRCPHHSLSRLLARLRVRRQGHRLCAHRPPPQAPGHDAALCAGSQRRGDPVDVLPPDRHQGRQARLEDAVRVRAFARHDAGRRPQGCQVRRHHRQGGREDHSPSGA